MALIYCEDLTMSYENSIVLKDINFEINEGDYICIVGENGSGKSTLIKGLLGIKAPKSGRIRFGDGVKQNQIGYVPQQTSIQKDFPASVFEVVLSGCLNKRGFKPFFSKKEKKIALDSMRKLGIEDLMKKSYADLSGGQQQRVLLSRALCATEKLLLLDEPVTGLDPVVTAEFYELIKKLNKENKITIIMVSHDITSATENANKILHIDGKVLFYGSTEEYRNSDVSNRFIGGVTSA